MRHLRSLLAGGSRRSTAGVERALVLLREDYRYVAKVAASTSDEDPLVSLRALDLLAKVAHQHPAWVEPYKDLLIGPLADSAAWEIRRQIVRALPLFAWNARELPRVHAILRRDARHPQAFVRTWALDGLATMALADPGLLDVVRRHLRQIERSGNKALLARARQIRRKLDRRRLAHRGLVASLQPPVANVAHLA